MKQLIVATLMVAFASQAHAGFVGSYIGAAAGVEDAVKRQTSTTASAYTTTSKTCQCIESDNQSGVCVVRSRNYEYKTLEKFATVVCGFTKIKQITTIFRQRETRFVIEGE